MPLKGEEVQIILACKQGYVSLFILIMTMIGINQAFSAIREDGQTWVNITAIGDISPMMPKLKYWLEDQERFGEGSSYIHQILLRPGIGYSLSHHTSIWLGYNWIETHALGTRVEQLENRVWQQILWKKTYPIWTVLNRLRLEERYTQPHEHTGWRLRELFKVSYPLGSGSKLSLVSSDELFFQIGPYNGVNREGLEQNRYFIGLGYSLSKHVTTELGYMNQLVRRVSTPNFMANVLSMQFILT